MERFAGGIAAPAVGAVPVAPAVGAVPVAPAVPAVSSARGAWNGGTAAGAVRGRLPRLRAGRRTVGQHAGTEEWLRRGLIGLAGAWLLVALVLPLGELLSRSLTDKSGAFVGLANYVTYFRSPGLATSFGNSLLVALGAAALSVTLGFVYAYAMVRRQVAGRAVLLTVAMLPLYMPSLLHGIALVYLFGNKDVITTGFFGFFSERWGINPAVNIHLYGPTGVVLGEVLYCFPQAVLVCCVALAMTDARLYEAARSLGASRLRTFWTVTLPGVRYGLVSAFIVCFTMAFTDFGVPKVVGGRFNVLATDVYKQVIGQQNFVMGATVSVLLLLPTALAFLADALVRRRHVAQVTARSVPLHPRRDALMDRLFFTYCALICVFILALIAVTVAAALATAWPYTLTPTLKHFTFQGTGGGGYGAYWNSVRVALLSAVVGTVACFSSAYLVEKTRGLALPRAALVLLSTIPAALPGLVIGIAYIFFFNRPVWRLPLPGLPDVDLPNPLHGLYGTLGILVLANVVHFYTVGFITATTALKQLDGEFESVSASLGVPFYRTFWRVTLPVCLPALLEIGMYFFVNAMVTVSAVVFLYGPSLRLAAVSVMTMDDAGNGAAAAAMALLIVGTNLLARLLYGAVTFGLRRRALAWRTA